MQRQVLLTAWAGCAGCYNEPRCDSLLKLHTNRWPPPLLFTSLLALAEYRSVGDPLGKSHSIDV